LKSIPSSRSKTTEQETWQRERVTQNYSNTSADMTAHVTHSMQPNNMIHAVFKHNDTFKKL
jgi:hypothetical protein